jgi:7-cyano-7-deazaguanine synthase
VTTAILLSGGMDSTALAYWLRPSVAFTVDYGQCCAAGERRAASIISETLGLHHEVIRVDCRSLGSGDLANSSPSPVAPVPEWWPFRNQLLVTLCAMRGISLGVRMLLVGAVASDAVHADGSKEFFQQLDALVALQEGKITVSAPAIEMTSDALISRSGIGIEVLAWAHSCHTSNYACGQCRGCSKHRAVMAALGYETY